MLELKTSMGKSDDSALSAPPKSGLQERNQRRMMLTALALLVVALVVVIYRDRDFWFPDTDDADDLAPVPATVTIQTRPAAKMSSAERKSVGAKSSARRHPKEPAGATTDEPQNTGTPLLASNDRTVLPPLEVEVVAGDYHRHVRPGTNSLQVDLQPDTPSAREVPISTDPNAANMTTNAAENLRISSEAAQVVSQPVRPGYPVLARQMKVQGSVILQALIGRDGLIQNLQVLTGPPILADAAEEAVRQWRFKPHYLNNQPVETQTSITVNFTISTN